MIGSMLKKIKIWCDVGIITCKDTELKFTEYGIMLENSEEELFIPYGSIHLVRGNKDGKNSRSIRLQKYDDKEDHDCT